MQTHDMWSDNDRTNVHHLYTEKVDVKCITDHHDCYTLLLLISVSDNSLDYNGMLSVNSPKQLHRLNFFSILQKWPVWYHTKFQMDHMLKQKGVFSWITTLTRSSSWRQHLPTLRHTNSLMQLKTPPMSSYSQCGKLHNTMQNKNNSTKSTGRNYLMHPPMTIVANNLTTTRYDTRCYFNVRSKANMSQLNLPHGTDN